VASGGMTVIPKSMDTNYLVIKLPKTQIHGTINLQQAGENRLWCVVVCDLKTSRMRP